MSGILDRPSAPCSSLLCMHADKTTSVLEPRRPYLTYVAPDHVLDGLLTIVPIDVDYWRVVLLKFLRSQSGAQSFDIP